MKRRTILKASAGLATLPGLGMLGGCGPKGETVAGFEEGMYLAGNFGPVEAEVTETALEVEGALPRELVGRFVRNGPNPIGEVGSKHHWFLGDGMLHGIRIADGKADWYRNRWVRGRGVLEKLGESAPPSAPSSSPNTHVIGHAGRTWAIVESGGPPVSMSYELETVGEVAGWDAYTAHPKIDPDTGHLHALCYNWAEWRDHIKYLERTPDGHTVKSMEIPLAGMTMIHDMALTERYVVIMDLPVTVSFLALGTGYRFPFRWDPEHEPRIGLLPRDGGPGDIVWSPISPQAAFHPMNAYEQPDGQVVIDVCRYDRMFEADVNGPFGDSLPRLDRWTVNPQTRTVSETIVYDRPVEFPRCHPALNSKPYRWGYSVASEGPAFPGILKHDMQSGSVERMDFGPGRHGGEPLFVPREGGSAEDDGYLMTFVYDQGSDRSEFVVLDARDMGRPPLATVRLPTRVPYGFHGSWIPDAEVGPA